MDTQTCLQIHSSDHNKHEHLHSNLCYSCSSVGSYLLLPTSISESWPCHWFTTFPSLGHFWDSLSQSQFGLYQRQFPFFSLPACQLSELKVIADQWIFLTNNWMICFYFIVIFSTLCNKWVSFIYLDTSESIIFTHCSYKFLSVQIKSLV